MANFDQALQILLTHEGGYVDDPDDPGGETFRGISRQHHPSWEGWERIDSFKPSPQAKALIEKDTVLAGWVRDFYDRNYWRPIGGPAIVSQDLADQMLSAAVHIGVKRAVIMLQRGLNVLNRGGRLWPDVTIDGVSGAQTRSALKNYETIEAPNYILKALIVQLGAHYVKRGLEHEVSQKYIRGWLRRLQIR